MIWNLSRNKTEIVEKISADKTEILERISATKSVLDRELDASRQAAFTEYKEIRHEVATLIAKAYRELGESPRALREHVNSMELWMRDNLLPRKEYERDQDQILKAIERLTETMESRFSSIDRKLERDV